ncbi:MAG TPA: PilZ domain-containing protein [Clostridia bacterium]|nr:PilZ domain-containing protein [Clostridia bacterium]
MESGDTKKDKNFVEMRRSKRIDYLSKIYCIKSINNGETEEYEEPLEMPLLNVSAGGLGIISGRLFEKGSVLVLRMKLEEISYDKVTAKVMWTIKKGDMFRHGLEITNISGKLYSHLSRLDNSITTTV